MRRIRDYLNFVAWQAGLSYLLMWAVTFWALDQGVTVFGSSGVCHPNAAKELFYWVCDPSSPFDILAAVVNVALTATVWAPVYIAAASVRPDAMALAGPIVAVHVVGLPLAMFVLVRTIAALLDFARRKAHAWNKNVAGDRAGPAPRAKAVAAFSVPPLRTAPPRREFGMRARRDVRRKPGERRQGRG